MGWTMYKGPTIITTMHNTSSFTRLKTWARWKLVAKCWVRGNPISFSQIPIPRLRNRMFSFFHGRIHHKHTRKSWQWKKLQKLDEGICLHMRIPLSSISGLISPTIIAIPTIMKFWSNNGTLCVEMRLVLHCSRAAKLGGDFHMVLVKLRIRLKIFTLGGWVQNNCTTNLSLFHLKSRPMSKP